MDGLLHSEMSRGKIFIATLIITIGMLTTTAVKRQPPEPPGPTEFIAFREKKLGLSEESRTVYLACPGEDIAGPAEGIKAIPFTFGGEQHTLYTGPTPSRTIKKLHLDLDRDGGTELYSLQNGILTAESCGKTIWQSPGEWWVEDFFNGDANNDGIPDLNLLVWKAGSFGERKPFWVTEEDKSVKNHLFIFDLAGGSIRPVWQSSNLDRPNHGSVLQDLDGDGKNELIVGEGDYGKDRISRVTVWRWNGWGFTLISSDWTLQLQN